MEILIDTLNHLLESITIEGCAELVALIKKPPFCALSMIVLFATTSKPNRILAPEALQEILDIIIGVTAATPREIALIFDTISK